MSLHILYKYNDYNALKILLGENRNNKVIFLLLRLNDADYSVSCLKEDGGEKNQNTTYFHQGVYSIE